MDTQLKSNNYFAAFNLIRKCKSYQLMVVQRQVVKSTNPKYQLADEVAFLRWNDELMMNSLHSL